MIRKSLAALSFAAVAPMAAAQSVTMCVFDVIGANGDMYNMVKDYALEMKAHGVDFELRPYTDEGVAVGDFNSGQCDAVAATDLRTRPFNRFTGSISAVGAIPTYDDLKTTLATLAQAKAAPLMKQGDYEVLGIVPAGAGYLFVNDRSIDTAGLPEGRHPHGQPRESDGCTLRHHQLCRQVQQWLGGYGLRTGVCLRSSGTLQGHW